MLSIFADAVTVTYLASNLLTPLFPVLTRTREHPSLPKEIAGRKSEYRCPLWPRSLSCPSLYNEIGWLGVSTHTHVYIYSCKHMHVYIYTYVSTHTHTHIHTHTYTTLHSCSLKSNTVYLCLILLDIWIYYLESAFHSMRGCWPFVCHQTRGGRKGSDLMRCILLYCGSL